MTKDQPSILDQSVLDSMTAGISSADVDMLLSSLEREITLTYQMINEARAGNDWHMLEVKAHALKSAAASFGAMRLSAVCLSIEHNAQTERDNEGLEKQCLELVTVINDTRSAFGWI